VTGAAAELRCRPLAASIADTCAWLRTAGLPPAVPRPTAAHSQPPTLTPAKEAAILARIG
jgi:hypothetical protein